MHVLNQPDISMMPDEGALEKEVCLLKKRLQRERQARLDAEAISENSLRILYDKQKHLQLLQVIADAANEAASFQDVLQFAIHQICTHTGWPVGHVYLSSRCDPPTLIPTSLWHLAVPERFAAFRRLTEATSFPSGVGLPGRVLESGAPVWLADVAQDNNFARRDAAREAGLHAGFGFPVKADAEVIAVLEFFAASVIHLDASLLEVMAHIAAQLGRVAERRQAEKALLQAEENYRSLFENAIEGIFQTTPSGQYLGANPALARIYGYDSPRELMVDLTDISRQLYVAPGRREAFAALMQEHDVVSHFESQVRRKDGGVIWISENARAVRDASGMLLRYEGSVQDITLRKGAEKALRESEERYRVLVEASPEAIVVYCESRVVYVNEAAVRLFGAERAEQLLARSVFDLVHPDGRTGARECARLAQEEGLPSPLTQQKYVRLDSSVIDVEAVSTPISWEGKPAGQVLIRDITERKRAEEEVRASREMLQSIMDNIPQLIFWKDTQSVYQGCNQNFARAAGIGEPAGIKGKIDDDLPWKKAESDFFRAVDRRVMDADTPEYHIIEPQQQADGKQSWIETNKIPLHDAAGQVVGILGTYEDITERIHAEQQILQLNALLEQRLESITFLNYELALAYDATIEGWSRALDLRDKETEGHCRRVTDLTLRLAEAMGMDGEELIHVRRGALLHDIGKMGIPDGILLKPGRLSEEEWVIMRRHPAYALEMLSPIEFLRPALDIPYCHHEKWDGSGYPQGLQGEEIPLAARLFAVVDVWDALRSDRPYRQGWPPAKVRAHIQALSGTHFDPRIVACFLSLISTDGRTERCDFLMAA